MYKLLDNKIVYTVSDVIKGEVDFDIKGDSADIYHTYVDDDLRGQGIASELVKRAFEYLEENNYKIKCSCLYAKNWAMKKGKAIS